MGIFFPFLINKIMQQISVFSGYLTGKPLIIKQILSKYNSGGQKEVGPEEKRMEQL
jgi:hypothetical protein